MNIRNLARIGSVVALSAAAAGYASASAGAASAGATKKGSNASLQALYKKAVAAGQTKVVIYGPSAGTDDPMYKAFEKEFPKISVSGVPVVGPPMTAKLQAEFSSGKHVGDIAYTGSTNMMQYAKNGWLVSYAPATAPATSKMVSANVGPHHDFYGITVSVFGTVYNTNAITSPPTTWKQLENVSEWTNKLVIAAPTGVGDSEDLFAHTALVPSLSNLEPDLKEENVELLPASDITGPITAVVSGSKELAIEQPYAFYLPAKSGGAPVGFQLLKADNYYTTLYMGVLKGAPDPLAAKLYEAWTLTSPASAAINSEGEWSAVLSNKPPKGMPALKTIPSFPTISLAHIDAADNAAIAKATSIFG